MMSEVANFGLGNEVVPEGFTAEYLRLRRKASRLLDILCMVALVACLGIALFVLTSVP